MTSAVADAGAGAAAGSVAGPVGTVIGAGIGLVGGLLADDTSASNASAANQASEDMFYANLQQQRDLAENAEQYRVADLEKAGLNPMLAATQGVSMGSQGSSIPSIQTPSYRSPIDSAVSAASLFSDYQQKQSQLAVSKAQADQLTAAAQASSASAAKDNADAAATIADMPNIPLKGELLSSQSIAARGSGWQSRTQGMLNQMNLDAKTPWALSDMYHAQAGLSNSASTLNRLSVPGAENKADSDMTWWGTHVRPYLPDASSAVNSASKAYLTFP